MKYLGLDIASTTGWAFFEDDKLIERGTIQLISGMDLPQKLHYFHLELKNLLNRLQPEYCFIEDVILGISGAKTLAYLARLNGVAINTAFEILQQRVKLYTPTYWKANSYDGLNGMAKKWQIQLAVVDHYGIDITGNFDDIMNMVDGSNEWIDDTKENIKKLGVDINKLKSSIKKKRNPPTADELDQMKSNLKDLESQRLLKKKDLKLYQKNFDKQMISISNDIAAQSGFTNDISDACGIAYCGYCEIK